MKAEQAIALGLQTEIEQFGLNEKMKVGRWYEFSFKIHKQDKDTWYFDGANCKEVTSSEA